MIPSEKRIRWRLIAIGLGAFVLLLTLEIIGEDEALNIADVSVDAITILLTITASVGTALLAQRMQAQHEDRMRLLRELRDAREDGDKWRTRTQSHVDGIKASIDRQFERWQLTSAEREVGLSILKGLNHKDIARLRKTTEATVRQQAQAIYRKANLPGKTAFSAYFLEDLLTPRA